MEPPPGNERVSSDPLGLRLSDERADDEFPADGPPTPATSEAAEPATAAAAPAPDPARELLARYLPAPAGLEFETEGHDLLERLSERRFDPPADHRLHREAQRLSLVGGFELRLCPPLLHGVEHHDYQLDTARQVMRSMRGRALLCDEVGLGKTIEAGLVPKEYAIRGLARRVLVLVPPSLVSQWRDEMRDKFGLHLVTPEDAEFRDAGPERSRRAVQPDHAALAGPAQERHRVPSRVHRAPRSQAAAQPHQAPRAAHGRHGAQHAEPGERAAAPT